MVKIHVGKLVEAEYRRLRSENSGCTVTWLAAQMNCDRRNIHDIFHRSTLDTSLLIQLSEVLHHNFFEDISISLEATIKASDKITIPARTRKCNPDKSSDNRT
ncbi:MAG: hypothetical protein NC217_04600 [Muribaculaceae bacterium]|nr:hypothetical protein [Muribaculaceae bacterium]